MQQQQFSRLHQGDVVEHNSGEKAFFQQHMFWADTGLVLTERGILQLWTNSELKEQVA